MSMTIEPTIAADQADQAALAVDPSDPAPEIDLAERRKTYRWFVRGTFLFAAHVLAALLILGYVFSDSFG